MKFVVIGITDHPQPFFPLEVQTIIKNGKVFSGGRRHHDIVAPLLPADAEWIDITTPLDAVFEQYRSLTFVPALIVFASGDPLFFGFANTIRRLMPDADIQLFPTFNSLQMLAHRLILPYHDMRIVSLTGRPWQEFDRALIERASKIGILTDKEHSPAAIAQRMLEYGYTHYTMHVGEHLGNPSLEQVSTLTLEEASHRDFAMPNCVILDAKYSASHASLKYGLPDSSFALLDGREKMITKMPIRLLALQALDLTHRHVFWDIGACTGSVSIEARLLFPHLQIEAFEIRPECEAIIAENARRHGAPGINVHIGDFLENDELRITNDEFHVPHAGNRHSSNDIHHSSFVICHSSFVTRHSSIASPDAVFIGGHGGRLKEIMAKVLTVLAPGGVIVMNSVKAPKVLTDSHQLWDEACRELGLTQVPPMKIVLNDNHPIEILKAWKD